MNGFIRRKLSMVGKALDFVRANPSTNAGYVMIVTRLTDRAARADALADQEKAGRLGEQMAISRRRHLRTTIHQQLRHLEHVGIVAAMADTDLVDMFDYPAASGPNRTFLSAARTMLEVATTHRAALEAAGLGDTFITDLTAGVAEFDAATAESHAGRRDRVGANSELPALAAECTALVVVLDGLVRTLFVSDRERLGAWESATNVFGPVRRRSAEPAAGTGPVLTPVLVASPIPTGTVVQVA